LVGSDGEGRQPHLHSEADMVGVGFDVDQVRPHARSAAIHDGGNEWDGDARRREGHNREGPHLALCGDVDRLEFGPLAPGARVATVEVAGPTRGALVRRQMRLITQLQILDERYLIRHHSPSITVGWSRRLRDATRGGGCRPDGLCSFWAAFLALCDSFPS